MKRFYLIILLVLSVTVIRGQNTFPATGRVGIGTTSPQSSLDINGNLILRDYSNAPHHGSAIEFTSYGDTTYPGPKIRGSLLFAQASNSQSQLILSSYNGLNGGYKNEITIWNGMVGIGTSTPQEALSVNGNIRSKQIKVEIANWPDFVFDKDYKLPSLKTINKFILTFHHLPEVPGKAQILKEGLDLGEMNRILLQKIEELTIYAVKKDNTEAALELKVRLMSHILKSQAKFISHQERRLTKIEKSLHLVK